ncbi:MAG TPA: PDZ domain-containing protein [Polyangiales bacterium]|nr:PDZ domain-containing protein [Polyangiales bacterium]
MQHPEALTQIANSLNGLPILGCASGSPAARAGLQYGDILLALNGTPTPSWAAFFEAAHGQNELCMRVVRQGRELALHLQLDASARTPRAVLDAPYREKAQPRALALTAEQLDLS